VETRTGNELGFWSRSDSSMSAWDVLMNVFVVDCDGWRLVVCQVSVWEIHDDENGIIERIVVEVVDVVKLKDDGW